MTIPEYMGDDVLAECLRLEGIQATPVQVEALHRRLTEPLAMDRYGRPHDPPAYLWMGKDPNDLEDFEDLPVVKQLINDAIERTWDEAEERWDSFTYSLADITRIRLRDGSDDEWTSDLDDYVCNRINSLIEEEGAKIMIRRNDR